MKFLDKYNFKKIAALSIATLIFSIINGYYIVPKIIIFMVKKVSYGELVYSKNWFPIWIVYLGLKLKKINVRTCNFVQDHKCDLSLNEFHFRSYLKFIFLTWPTQMNFCKGKNQFWATLDRLFSSKLIKLFNFTCFVWDWKI